MTRAQIQDKLRELVKTNTNPDLVKEIMETWLKETCDDFETKQVLNDLTSYQEYLDIGGHN